MTSEQLVMLLELLLEEEELSVSTVRALQRTYDLQSQDAEVRPHTHTHTHARTSERMHPKLYNLLPIIRK